MRAACHTELVGGDPANAALGDRLGKFAELERLAHETVVAAL
jgi:hypothetical protein